jgi:uncharacterized membrane protein
MSHYALAIIFIFFFLLVFFYGIVTKSSNTKLNASMILVFLVIMFLWYIYIANAAAFNDILSYGNFVFKQLGRFFDPASRGDTVLVGLGLDTAPSIWNGISRIFAYVTELLLILGFIGVITKKTRFAFDKGTTALFFFAIVFLGVVILVPGMARTFNMSRFYHILLFFLAPLLVVGAAFSVKLIFKNEKKLLTTLLLLAILIPYFLFQTSFMFEVAGSQSWSLSLSGYRMSPYQLYRQNAYITESAFFGAGWLGEHVDKLSTEILVDGASKSLLISYGSIDISSTGDLSNITRVSANDVVFLGPLNVVYHEVSSAYYENKLNDLSYLGDLDKIYSNGGSEVYRR